MPLKLIQGKQINVNLTGSFTGSFSGFFNGTGSYATQALSASYALSSSFATNALTASYLSGYVSPFPYTGSAKITGSLEVIGPSTFRGNQTITGSIIFNSGSQITSTYYGNTYPGYIDIVAGAPGGFVELLSYNQSSSVNVDDFSVYITTNSSSLFNLWEFKNDGRLVAPRGIEASSFTGSLFGTSSYATQALSASFAVSSSRAISSSFATTASYVLQAVSASFTTTASFAPLYLPLTGGTINGNLTLNGTASIAFLNVTYESASVIFSSGSNIFGDATNDTQTLNGTVIVSGSQQITGSLNVSQGITGSLFGTASFAVSSSRAVSSSYAISASYAPTAATFPYTGSAQITGSLGITGSLTTTGSDASINGVTVGRGAGTGTSNVAIGTLNLGNNTTGFANTAVGSNAMGVNAGGFANVAVGANALSNVSSGYWNVGIGYNTTLLTNSDTNCIVIGTSAVGLGSNTVVIGDSNITLTALRGNIALGKTSANARLDVSGSALITGSLNVSAGITGSLFGTSSYAVSSSTAISASYALTTVSASNAQTASYVNPLNQTVLLTGSFNVSGSTTQIGTNNLLGNTTLSGSITISGSTTVPATPTIKVYGDMETNGVIKFVPVNKSINTTISGSYIYVSGSTNDLYFTQNGSGYANSTRLRWIEGNLYTGLLSGGVISSTLGSTTFNVSSGSGIIVTLNAFTASSDPYPTIQYISWPTYTGLPITNSGSAKITYLSINSAGSVAQQIVPIGSTDVSQWDTQIELGVVLHLSGSVSTGVYNAPQVGYGFAQRTDDFVRAFGPMKLSGHTLQASGSSPTLSLIKGSGTAYNNGANYVNNPNHPSTVFDPAVNTSKIYRYYISGSTPIIDTGVANAGYDAIDSKYYVDTTTGTLSLVGGAYWSIQRVFWIPNSPTNAFIVYYGNDRYRSLVDATNAKDSEPFIEAPNTAQNAIFLGYIIIQGGGSGTPARDLLNASEATILQGGLFRNVGGIGSSGTSPIATTFASLSDVSVASRTNGDLPIYNGSQWTNGKVLTGNYSINGNLTVTGSVIGTASLASTASNVQGGTANYIPLWNTGTSLSSSVLYQSAGNVGIGTTSPGYKLDVNGDGRFNGGLILPASSTITLGTVWNTGYLSIYNGATEFFVFDVPNTRVVNNLNKYLGNGPTSFGTLNADEIKFVTSNTTERMRITSAGNVGIGTTTPSETLDVTGVIRGIYSAEPGVTGSISTKLLSYSANPFGLIFRGYNSGLYSIQNQREGNNSQLFDLSLQPLGGNVGIGTTTPVTLLDVRGTILSSGSFGDNSVDSAYRLKFYDNGGVANDSGIGLDGSGGGSEQMWFNSLDGFKWYTGTNGEKMRITSTGNVGIGTTSPTYKLQVVGNSFFESNFSTYTADGLFSTDALPGVRTRTPGGTSQGIRLGYRDFGSGEYWGRIGIVGSVNWSTGIANSAGTSFSIGLDNTTATDYFTIVSGSGNVGIGTTTPNTKLDISGSVNISGSGVQVPLQIYSGSTPLLVVSQSGNVGIGTSTPTHPLNVYTTVADTGILLDSNTNPAFIIKRAGVERLKLSAAGAIGTINGLGNGLVFQVDSSEKMRISTAGNVGIGTTLPNAKLDVSGSAIISGSLNVAAGITGSLFGTASFAQTASFALQVSTSISTQNLQHNVLFVDTSGPGFIQVDGGLRYNPNQDLLTTTSSYTLLANTASYVQNAQSASYVLQAVSSSYALTASFAPNYQLTSSTGSMLQPYVLNTSTSSFATTGSNIFIGNQTITGSLTITGSFNVSGSTTLVGNKTVTGSIFITGSKTIIGNNTVVGTNTITGSLFVTGSIVVTGSLRGNVSPLSIASTTASFDLATSNFFTLTLANGANTHVSASNILPGQTVNIRVTQGSAGTGTLSFNSAIKQSSGSLYTGSMIANAVDVVSLIAFDSSSAYISYINNFV